MILDTENIIENIFTFIRNNNDNPNFVHVSKKLFTGVESIGISLPDYDKDYSVIIEDGILSNILNEKRDNHQINVSLSTSQISELIHHYKSRDYLALIKGVQKLNIPLKYKLRFGRVYLTSSYEINKCKELLEKHNFI